MAQAMESLPPPISPSGSVTLHLEICDQVCLDWQIGKLQLCVSGK